MQNSWRYSRSKSGIRDLRISSMFKPLGSQQLLSFVNPIIDETRIANNFGYRIGRVTKLGRRVLGCVADSLAEYGRGGTDRAYAVGKRVRERSKLTKVLCRAYN